METIELKKKLPMTKKMFEGDKFTHSQVCKFSTPNQTMTRHYKIIYFKYLEFNFEIFR